MNKASIRYMGGIIATSSAVDQSTQALSVFNVIDEITVDLKAKDGAEVIPNSLDQINIPISFQIISLWKRNNLSDQGKSINAKIEAELLDPLGTSLNKINLEIPIPADKKRSRNILTVGGLGITTTGEYVVQFREILPDDSRSDLLASLILDIVVNKS